MVNINGREWAITSLLKNAAAVYQVVSTSYKIGSGTVKLFIKNKSSINRRVIIQSADDVTAVELFRGSILQFEFTPNVWGNTVFYLIDLEADIHFDVYGAKGLTHKDQSFDLNDDYILHHGTYFSHEFLRSYGNVDYKNTRYDEL